MIYRFCRWVARQFLAVFCPGAIVGREHVPARGPALLLCNHNSHLDPPLVGAALRRPVHFMAKAELFAVPGFGGLIRRLHAFPVTRESADRAALRYAEALLARGELLVLFPEGRRSPDGVLGDPELGAALLAVRSGAPVIPTVVLGSEQALPAGARWPRRRPVTVHFGKPFVPDAGAATGQERLRVVAGQIMRAMAALLPPERRGKWSLPPGPLA